MIRDLPILLAKTLAIWEALKHAVQEKHSRVIIESDSLTAIKPINGNSIPLILICNLVEDIKCLA